MLSSLLLSAALSFAAQAQASSAPAAERVRIDAVVGDSRGRPVETLGIGDFSVSEDGTARVLESVDLVRDAPRLVAVFLDEFHTSPANAERVRAVLARFMRAGLAPHDQVVVLKPLDSLSNIQLSTDH